MKRSKIETEMEKRTKEDEKTYGMIGTELKRIRQSQSQTLSSIAGDICSVSYLCKVEKAQLKPNRYMLQQICKRLQLDEPKMDLLFDLKKYLNEIVHCYYNRKNQRIIEIYNQCREFDNYRSKLICFIYCLSTYDIERADLLRKELLKLMSVMMNDEVAIFMTFYSILCYFQENYLEAIDNLKYIEKQAYDDCLIHIAKYQLFLCYFKINHPLTCVYGKEIQDVFYQNSDFFKADFVKYLIGIYHIHNDMVEIAAKSIHLLQNLNYKKSLEFFCDCYTNQLKNPAYYDHLRPFARVIHTFVFQREKYLNLFLKLDKSHFFECDFSYNIANYLTLEDDKEKLYELENVIIPNLSVTKNRFEISFFLQELCKISTRLTRYKYFCRAFNDLVGTNFKDLN